MRVIQTTTAFHHLLICHYSAKLLVLVRNESRSTYHVIQFAGSYRVRATDAVCLG